MKKPSGCVGCVWEKRGKGYCPGSGDPKSPRWLIGEGPGQEEIDARVPEPFIGSAGFEINRSLRSAGISRDSLYITNATKCKPPEDARPHEWAAAIAHCSRYFNQEVESGGTGDKKVLILGSKASLRIFGRDPYDKAPSISEIRGSLYRADDFRDWPHVDLGYGQYAPRPWYTRDNVQLVPTLHPAFIIRGMHKWRTVVARDVFKAYRQTVKRPLPLPLVRPIFEIGKISEGAEVLIDLETEWKTTVITMIGILAEGRAYQGRYNPQVATLVSSLLTNDHTIVGHNIVSFDLPVLSANMIEHNGPYFDTIALARLEEADLPVGLREVVSRNVVEFVAWKGLTLGGGLQKTLCHVFDLSGYDNTFGLGVPWDSIYNLIDLYWDAKAKAEMWNRMTEDQKSLFLRAHVATVPHRLAMHARGMKWNRPYGEQREQELWEDQSQLGAELMEIVDQSWGDRVDEQRDKVVFIDNQMTVLSARYKGSPLSVCDNHPKFDGLRKVRAKACESCDALYAARSQERLGYEKYKKARTSAKTTLKTLEKGFNPQSSPHWQWLLFGEMGLHIAKEREWGPEWFSGLVRKRKAKLAPGWIYKWDTLSVDDDALAFLQRKLDVAGRPSRLIDLRIQLTKNYKLLGTYFTPFNSRVLLDIDDMGFPVYNDFKSRMGRWSGGGEEEGIDK